MQLHSESRSRSFTTMQSKQSNRTHLTLASNTDRNTLTWQTNIINDGIKFFLHRSNKRAKLTFARITLIALIPPWHERDANVSGWNASDQMSHPNYSLCSNLLVKSVIQDEHQTIKLKRTDASYTAGTLQGSHKDVACSCNASSLDAPLSQQTRLSFTLLPVSPLRFRWKST